MLIILETMFNVLEILLIQAENSSNCYWNLSHRENHWIIIVKYLIFRKNIKALFNAIFQVLFKEQVHLFEFEILRIYLVMSLRIFRMRNTKEIIHSTLNITLSINSSAKNRHLKSFSLIMLRNWMNLLTYSRKRVMISSKQRIK